MAYFIVVVLILILLGLIAFRQWLLKRNPNQKTIEDIHKKVSQSIALNKWEKATQTLKFLRRKKFSGVDTEILYLQILRGTKQFDKALNIVEKALSKHSNNLSLLKEKGKILLHLGKSEKALKALQSAEPIFRGVEDILDFATALFQTEKYKAAWKAIKPIMKTTNNRRLYALAGDCHFRQGKYKAAISYYKKTQKAGWNNYQVLSRMGHSLRCLGRLEEAEYYFQQILKKDPSDIFATLGLGACLESRGTYDKALAVYQTGKAWDFGDTNILRQAGICAVHAQKYDFAEIYLRESTKRGVKSTQALAFLGYSLEKQKRWEEAEKIYLQVVDEYPKHFAGYRALAWLYGVGLSHTLDSKRGLEFAYKALELLPDTASWEMLSACEARAGNFKKAHSIQEGLSNRPDDENTRLRRRQVMKALRKKTPLDESQVSRAMVA